MITVQLTAENAEVAESMREDKQKKYTNSIYSFSFSALSAVNYCTLHFSLFILHLQMNNYPYRTARTE